MERIVITVEMRDHSEPAKVSKPTYPDVALSTIQDLIFRVATGEYSAVYVTREKPIPLVDTSKDSKPL